MRDARQHVALDGVPRRLGFAPCHSPVAVGIEVDHHVEVAQRHIDAQLDSPRGAPTTAGRRRSTCAPMPAPPRRRAARRAMPRRGLEQRLKAAIMESDVPHQLAHLVERARVACRFRSLCEHQQIHRLALRPHVGPRKFERACCIAPSICSATSPARAHAAPLYPPADSACSMRARSSVSRISARRRRARAATAPHRCAASVAAAAPLRRAPLLEQQIGVRRVRCRGRRARAARR